MKKAFLLITVLLISVFLSVSCELIETKPSKGTLHVVAIGDNFTGRSDVRQLSSCENDADAVCQVFEYWGRKAGMKTDIRNCSGTYFQGFKNALLEVSGIAQDNDLTVIFVSTHGTNDIEHPVSYASSNADGEGFILEQEGTADLIKISRSEILSYSLGIKGKVLFLADFCYSGSFIHQDNFTYNSANYTDSSPLRLFFDSIPATDSNKVFMLTSSTYYELSWAGSPLSAYTNSLLGALGLVSYNPSTDKATISSSAPVLKNNRIILSDVYKYIYEQTSNSRNSSSQVPQMNTGANDLILFSL